MRNIKQCNGLYNFSTCFKLLFLKKFCSQEEDILTQVSQFQGEEQISSTKDEQVFEEFDFFTSYTELLMVNCSLCLIGFSKLRSVHYWYILIATLCRIIPVQEIYLVESSDIGEVDFMLLCIFWFIDYNIIFFLPKIHFVLKQGYTVIFLCKMPFVLTPSMNLVIN